MLGTNFCSFLFKQRDINNEETVMFSTFTTFFRENSRLYFSGTSVKDKQVIQQSISGYWKIAGMQ